MTAGPAKVTIYGKQGSPQAYAIRDFLYRSDVPFEWVPITSDEDARLAGLERPREDGREVEGPPDQHQPHAGVAQPALPEGQMEHERDHSERVCADRDPEQNQGRRGARHACARV